MNLNIQEQIRSDEIYDDLTSGNPDGTHMEWLWQTIEGMLECGSHRIRIDAIEDMTLADIIRKLADEKAVSELG